MKRHPRALFRSAAGFLALLAMLVALEASPAAAQEFSYQYAVKCICGRPASRVVAPGVYFTAINVHNPGKEGVHFRKKIAVALPSEKAGPVSRFFEARLGPDEALEIDCPDIQRHAGAGNERFLKGFVVIESPTELDVVAVYTASGSSSQVQTIALERVPPRKQ
jgi:hypothetical protein